MQKEWVMWTGDSVWSGWLWGPGQWGDLSSQPQG